MADKPTCKTCPYWEHYDKDEDVDVGLCRRLSPKTRDMTELSAGTLETVWWPRTADFDWCGEHPEIKLLVATSNAEAGVHLIKAIEKGELP